MAEFGVSMFPTDYAIQPIELALAAEQRGFESLFFPEHTHIPASRKTPFPGGTELPKEYWHTHDPFVALGAAAAVTKKLKLGTGVCLVIERDPITLAKEVASLDHDFGWPRGFRNRRRLERRGDGESRRDVQAALENRQGKNSCDAANLDQGGRRVSRRVRRTSIRSGRSPNRCRPADRRFCSARNRRRPSSASPNIATDGCR